MLKNFIKKINRYKEDITVGEMFEFLKTNNNVTILDVRSVEEYKEAHINGSINIPVCDLEQKAIGNLKKDSIIIIYCSAGIRSKKAVKILRKLGYKNLYNVEGGINNLWIKV